MPRYLGGLYQLKGYDTQSAGNKQTHCRPRVKTTTHGLRSFRYASVAIYSGLAQATI